MRRASLLLAATLAATPALAQQQLAIGTQVSGVLTVASPQWSDGARYLPYTFYGQAGQTVTISMTSEYDNYLLLQDANGNQLAYNDDADGLNARLTHTLGYAGLYRIIAKAYRADAYGAFTLALTGSSGVAMGVPQPIGGNTAGPTMAGSIGANQQVTGNLTTMDGRWDGKPAHVWQFQCNAGQSLQMDILSQWDNYGAVFDPAGNRVAYDDDTGEGLNARINYTCTVMGIHRLMVTTYTTSTTPGTYTLQVQSAGAMAMQPQPMPMPTPMPMAPQAAPGATLPTPVGGTLPITGSIAAPGTVATITFGTNMQGRLETGDQQMNDGTWADVWSFQGTAGQRVRIELRSEEFDTYVQLLDGRDVQLAEDDDALGDLDSMLEYVLPATGTYKIVVNNYSEERRAGIYTLTLLAR